MNDIAGFDAASAPPQPPAEDLAALLAQLNSRPIVPQHSDSQTLHIGDADLPWAPVGDGSSIQLLHVDLDQGLWVTKTRFPAGHRVPKHYHTGAVFALTLQGRWFYLEAPEAMNGPGSYLFEPAGSVHTLATPNDQDGDTVAWFAIHGANLVIGPDGQIAQVVDAPFVLKAYRGFCAAMGLDASKLIAVGGP